MSLLNQGPSKILRKNKAEQADPDDAKPADEIDGVLAGFRARDREMRAKFADMNDTECWLAICFDTRADKDAFLAASGFSAFPLVPGTAGDKYIDGYAFADAWLGALESPPEE